jgi:hypothetical protein
MSDSNDPTLPPARPTLRLKVPPRQTPAAREPSTPMPAQGKSASKPGARWSDEYRDRMQADMDALASR